MTNTLRHLSQSEAADWALCPLRAHARWILELRDGVESPHQIGGSIGHAIVADRVRARWQGRAAEPEVAADREAEKRGWKGAKPLSPDYSEGWHAHFPRALIAADRIVDALHLDHVAVAPNLYTDEGGPLAEVRLRAGWGIETRDAFLRHQWKDIRECHAILSRFAGIEGQPDLCIFPDGAAGPMAIVDHKFRTRPDLGGAAEPSTLPDRQASWYLTLLRALGCRPAGGFEFWQVNAFAGDFIDAETLIEIGRRRPASPEFAALVVDSGLPTRDLNRFAAAGVMITASQWAEAHRVLANDRHAGRVTEWQFKGGKGKRPDVLTSAEENGANRFVADLRAWQPVHIKKFRADPQVCAEVVRDMIVGVEGPLAVSLRGLSPARHLQTWGRSPCVRPFGCPIQGPCQSSLGSGEVLTALRHHAEVARATAAAACEVEEEYA